MAPANLAERAHAVASSLAPAQETKPNILIVDDRSENLLATEKVLKPLNASIFKAQSGNEALSLLLRHRFAIVLLDVQMPEMDGFETAMLMQEHESMQGVPIIFVTAISKEEKYASQAAEIGAVDYIFKPINPDILKSKVKVYLDLYVQREHILNLNAVLSQSNEELERFAYVCSHDMQEPVRMMSNYADMLQQRCKDVLDERASTYLNFITSGAERLQRMIQDILIFSRIGREEITMEQVDCNEIMREVLAEFAGTIAEKNARVTCGPLPTLFTSTTLIRVLLQNLVGNGLKFQDGSKIPEIRVEVARVGDSWRFSVRDNGVGIAPEFHDRIFTMFQRQYRKDDYPGTGIGLSTCRKFIRLFGGDISFESLPGKGTEFRFSVPAR